MEKNSLTGIRKLPAVFNFSITKPITGTGKNTNTGKTTEDRNVIQADNKSKRTNNNLNPSKRLCKRTEVEYDKSERGMYSTELVECEKDSKNQYFDYTAPNDEVSPMECEDCDESEQPYPVCNGVNGNQKQVNNSHAAGDRIHTEQEISNKTARSNSQPDMLPDNEILNYEVDSENESKLSSLEAGFSDEEALLEEYYDDEDVPTDDHDDVPTERDQETEEMFEEEMLASEFEYEDDVNTQQETLSNTEDDDDQFLKDLIKAPLCIDVFERPVRAWPANNHFKPTRLFLKDIGYIRPVVAKDNHVFDVKSSDQFHQKVADNFVFKSPQPPKPVPHKRKELSITPVKHDDDAISLYAPTLSELSDDEDCDSPSTHFSRTGSLERNRRVIKSTRENSDLIDKDSRDFEFRQEEPSYSSRNLEWRQETVPGISRDLEWRQEAVPGISRNSEWRQETVPGISRNSEWRQETVPGNSRDLEWRQETVPGNSRDLELRQENLTNSSRNLELQQEKLPNGSLQGHNPQPNNAYCMDQIPYVFYGLCFKHFLNGSCRRKTCHVTHHILHDIFVAKCRKVKPSTKLIEAYEYSKKYPVLFEAAHTCFIDVFAYLKLEEQLINCVFDFITMQHKIDFPKAIRKVVAALNNGFTITLETFDKIERRVDLKQYPVLVEALMEALSMQRVSQNWCMLRKLIHVNNYIAPEIVNKLLMSFTSVIPLDPVISQSIYEEIIEKQLTDVSKVSPRFLNALNKPVNFFGETAWNGNHNPRELVRSRSDESISEGYMPGNKRQVKRCRSNEMISADIQVKTEDRYAPYTSNATSRSNEGYNKKSSTYGNQSRYKSFLDQIDDVQTVVLFPTSPIVGEFKYSNPLSLTSSISLHDLLPASEPTMGSIDHVDLQKCIRFLNAGTFLDYLKKDEILSAMEHFLFQCTTEFARDSSTFLKMTDHIKIVDPSYNKNPILKGVLEVIAFNLIILLDKRGEFEAAKKLIETFLDWDSMLTSKILVVQGNITHMGKYIQLATILVKSNGFFLGFAILSSLGLKLMEHPQNWPLNNNKMDLQNRNSLLNIFLERAKTYAKPELFGLYNHMFSTHLYGFDARKPFNSMLKNVFKQKDWSYLSHFSLSTEVFCKNMDIDKLRAFIVTMAPRSKLIDQRLKYFECGCMMGIYPRISGQESMIKIEVSMPETEIQLFLEQYFYKMRLSLKTYNSQKIKLPPGLTIVISVSRVSEGELDYLELIDSTQWTYANTHRTIKTLLVDHFRFDEMQLSSPDDKTIRISAESLMSWATRK
ncbi:uncharacterized protein LOC114339437 isoform X2 [Diabrotica virgifera virgifera]|uniref:Protein TOPAZ1 n=1 Tax=Diabrotica virgifera virgifera TaxID=50390 RepID=A0ABM5KKE6_DIAVI|nr:uncharacterized protein LOC114339437 isoform X2 [Diabrotica virgifera virgifera]